MRAPDRPAEAVNRRTWSRSRAVDTYQQLDGWLDAGERTALTMVADEVRGGAVLDLGIGAGRTTSLMRLLTPAERYIGVDWSPEMVAACRRRHPDLDVREGDARDLSGLSPGHFGLVLFSYNGIDNLGHDDRGRVFRETHRVLRPGGLFVYCTFNLLGPAFGQRPWEVRSAKGRHRGRAAASFVARLPRNLPRYRRMYVNWWRNRRLTERHETWAVGPIAGQEFGLLQHFTTIEAEQAALADAGLVLVAVVTSDGRVVSEHDTHDSPWLHVVARDDTSQASVPQAPNDGSA